MRTVGDVVDAAACRSAGERVTYVPLEHPHARDFAAEGIEPRHHLALAEALDAIDMEARRQVLGARSYS